MFCRFCGRPISENAKFCDECGKKQFEMQQVYIDPHRETATAVTPEPKRFCEGCGKEVTGQRICTNCGFDTGYRVSANAQSTVTQTKDKKSHGLNFLGWIFPVVGLIIFLVNRKEKPRQSKSVLKTAIASVVVNTLIVVLSAVLMFSGVLGSRGTKWEDLKQDYAYSDTFDFNDSYDDAVEDYKNDLGAINDFFEF